MLVVMHLKVRPADVRRVCRIIKTMGLVPHPIPGCQRVAIGITGNKGTVDTGRLKGLSGVGEIIHVTKPFKLASREMQPDDTVVNVAGIRIGGGTTTVIAGPCAVESRAQMLATARAVKAVGAAMLRGGAYKPRTSPYAFQGLGKQGLKILAETRERTGLPVVSEVMDTDQFETVQQYVDVLQIGARNMQNYSLLRKAGRGRKPVLLKRGMSATLTEFLLAAEYIMAEGNRDLILCERGIRTFNDYSRYTLDIGSIPELKQITHLPVIVDPSHAAGKRDLVRPLTRAAVAAGCDGVIVEVHPDPDQALSDGAQSLTFSMFSDLMKDLAVISTLTTGKAP